MAPGKHDAALVLGEEALLGQQEAQLQRVGEPDWCVPSRAVSRVRAALPLPAAAERCAALPRGCGIFSPFLCYREERPAGWAEERSGCVVPRGRQRPLG